MAGDKLDAVDVRILALLQKNGRIKKVELASAIGLSLSSCWDRLQKMEQAGYVRGYRGEIDLGRLVKTELIFTTLTLQHHTSAHFARFEQVVKTIPEILACHAVGGGIDYILHVIARNITHYQEIIDDLLTREIGISVYFTYVVTKTVKRFEGYPIAELLDVSLEAEEPPRQRRGG
ncbi:Lrp/AsnC family transcriptional regulator of ectoine degradation [Ancylobacter sp. 3268]|uniref:Lrp/AsnC family transcriptional regulator n=1 Tax=Ancylobacter sp. 3268 TaxID=2817752 RepID=UPI00285A2EB2|nr:Lrp/AsnC family transcriptional regulator [Ancylobacter sp. 3268]MDR6950982.1 Lrp/AsnC family transcriptional regulator of ectoine degradation [Ancylobacter sp. 3268]